MKRLTLIVAAVSAVAAAGLSGLTGGAAQAGTGNAARAGSLPKLKIALNGSKGIKIAGSTQSGAVKVVSTFKGKVPKHSHGPNFALVRLRPGVSLAQAFQAVQRSHGNLDALTPYATLFADASAPGAIETVFQPGNYAALNVTGNGQPAVKTFKVTKSSSPAALPAAAAKQTAIEFGFKGPKVLHDGKIVRLLNGGYLVHMIVMTRVRNAQAGRRVVRLLKAGKDGAAQKLATGGTSLLGPASPGAMQQLVLRAKPGYYVEACFMDTQDGREHTQLGMERLIRVVK